MRVLRIFLLLSMTACFAGEPEVFFDQADKFFRKIVIDGSVDYDAIRRQPQALRELQDQIAQMPLAVLEDDAQRKAFWINAYNISVIGGIIDHEPVNSPMDIAGFFDRIQYTIAGESLTLNDLEHQRAFKIDQDARLHFALVCAAIGCPVIVPFAYRPEQLDKQLDQRVRSSVVDSRYVDYSASEGIVRLSEIFRWYTSDFGGGENELIDYVNRYRPDPIPAATTIRFTQYDWRLNAVPPDQAFRPSGSVNLQSYTPSTLLRRGEMEVKQFNNLYTQTAFFDDDRNKIEEGRRSNYFTAINSFLYGLSPRLNVGADVYFRAVRIDDAGASPFATLRFSSGEFSRSTLSQIAPRVKLTPFAKIGNLSLQATLVLPIAGDLEGKNGDHPFLDYDDVQWWTQVFYDRPLSRRFLIYFEGGAFVRFDDETTVFTPFKSIINYYPSGSWTLYFPVEFAPTWEGNSFSAYYSQIGAGAKYQLFANFEVETLLTTFPIGRNGGAGNTFNLGFRYIR